MNVGPLDHNISKEELEKAARKLKPGKATGLDNIQNEMLYSLLQAHPDVILKLFNDILTSGNIPSEWVIGLVVPIYKKGQKSDPSNYRGISLTSCFGKLFLSILNNRLIDFTEKNNILRRCQLEFRSCN